MASLTSYTELKRFEPETSDLQARKITLVYLVPKSQVASLDIEDGELLAGDSGITGRTLIGHEIRQDSKYPGYSLVYATYAGINARDTATGNILEIPGRRLERIDEGYWKGIRRFLVYDDMVQGMCRSMMGQTYIGMSGVDAAVVHKVVAEDNPWGIKGKSVLVCHYETKRVTGRARVVKRAQILRSTTSRPKMMTVDLDNKIISGPDADGNEWCVVEGSPYTWEPVSEVIIQTAVLAKSYDPTLIAQMVNKVNAGGLPLLRAGKETLLFLGAEEKIPFGDELVYVNYRLLENPAGWNNSVKSQQGAWIVEDRPVYSNVAGKREKTSQTRPVEIFVPAQKLDKSGKLTESKAENRKMFKAVNFTILNALTKW